MADLGEITENCDDGTTPHDAASEDSDRNDADEPTTHTPAVRRPWRRSPARLAIAAGLGMSLAIGSLAGWMAYTASRHQNADNTRNLFVEVAKQGAINLTTISYTEVDQDVRRILDSSTGIFHEDFQHRSQPFIDVVKQVRSTSTGTVTAAGLESQDGDQAQVLVAVEVKTATNGAPPPQQARNWRMRISVQKVGDGAKVSNVQFVP
ncbi:hypothetical protein B5P44_08445 [Mycobacterium sp. CBMA 213]|nr:hypothetical protein [Mycolicibacterium sp. CBMA 213]